MVSDFSVVKPGGAVIGNPDNLDALINLLFEDTSRRFVTPSGPKGLTEKGSTDLYIEAAHEKIKTGEVSEETLRKIKAGWEPLCNRFGFYESLNTIMALTEGVLASYNGPTDVNSKQAMYFIDKVASRGERFGAEYVLVPRMIARGVPVHFLDTEGVMVGTDEPGNCSILPKSAENLRKAVVDNGLINDYVVVMPSWTCHTEDGEHVVTLLRNKGDVVGAFATNTLDAKRYDNITNDVIRRADPNIVSNALTLDKLTFDEALEYGYYGAGIFHHDAIEPCRKKSIPIHIINILNPQQKTIILHDRKPDSYEVTGIAHKPGFGSLDISRSGSRNLSLTHYVLQTELGNCVEGEFPIEHLASGVSGVSFLVPGDKFTDEMVHGRKRHLMNYFGLKESDIDTRYNISLLSVVVSKGMKDTPGIHARAASAVAALGISFSHVDQGGAKFSMIYAIPEASKKPERAIAAVRAIYNEFFVDQYFGRVIEDRRKQLQSPNSNK